MKLTIPGNQSSENSGSHSSEEELEEINIRNELERDSVTEKRKWSDLSHSELSSDSDQDTTGYRIQDTTDANAFDDRLRASSNDEVSSCDTLSGDEDQNHNKVLPVPVQFSTSPPRDVHKPRRSHSPPPKLFGSNNQSQQPQQLFRPQQEQQLDCEMQTAAAVRRIAGFSSSLGDLRELTDHSFDQTTCVDHDLIPSASSSAGKRLFTPRKRSRKAQLLSRPSGSNLMASNASGLQHQQSRPCLDFEKMQQLKMQNITSWRGGGGGELSLFCW